MSAEAASLRATVAVLYNLADRIRLRDDLGRTLDHVGAAVTDLIGAHRWSIMLRTEPDVIRIHSAQGVPAEVIRESRVRVGDGLAGGVAASGEACLLNDLGSGANRPESAQRHYRSASAMCVPIRIGKEVLGVINVTDKQDANGALRAFTEHDLALTQLIAGHAALAIDAIRTRPTPEIDGREAASAERASDLVRVQSAGFQVLSRVTARMAEAADLEEVLNEVLRGTIDLLGAARGSLMLLDETRSELRMLAAVGVPEEIVRTLRVPLGHGIAGEVAQSGEAVLMLDAPEARNDEDKAAGSKRYRTRSAMSLPLKREGEVLGVLNINDRHDAAEFTEADFLVAKALANQAGLAVATARLMNESIRAAEARRSLEVARSIQRSFLPDPVSVPGVEVGGMSEPCDETGGDYIDYFAETGSDGTPTGALYVICGDVSGHGIASALVMSMARAFLRALLPGSNSLADVIARVNRLIEADTPPDQYMTLFIARIDPDAGRLRYVSAGHEPALIRRHDGTILETESTGMPLGMLDFGDFEEREVTINPGDRLFLSTDGLSEAMGPSGERYGRARLLEDVLAWPDSPVDVWVQALHAKVQAFCRPLRFEDDFSVVVAQIR